MSDDCRLLHFRIASTLFACYHESWTVEAKRYLPKLREYLPQIPTLIPTPTLNERVTASTRQAIADIEKTTAQKKLVRIKDLKQ